MKKLMSRVWKHTIASLLGLGVSSAAFAQQPLIQPPALPAVPVVPVAPMPPDMPATLPPVMPPPALPGGVASALPTWIPAQPGGFAPPGVADALPNRLPVRAQPDPIMSSQPPPFQVTPNTPPPPDNAQGFAGNPPIRDLSALVAGNFRDTRYKWYGFVRVDGIYDFRPIASTDSFVTSSIPIPQGRGQNTVLTPRWTRFGFDTETPIKSLDWNLRTRIEVDFFNGNTSGAFGSFPLRLRFAWAEFGPFLIGQTASLFMDYDVFPNVLDYQGPGGMILMRQPIFALQFPMGEDWKFSIGVEQPYSDIQWFENGAWILNPGTGIITTPGVGRNIQDLPDFTGNMRYTGDYGHVQLAGILRKLTFQPAAGTSALDVLGYGFNVTSTFHPWAALTGTPRSGDCATPLSKSRFMGQFAAGRGITRYFQDENGLGLDATFDPINGFRGLPSYGWFLGYEQWWAKRWASVFTFGQDALELTNTLPDNTYQRAQYLSANIIWLPVDRLGVGIECLHGFRRNKDGGRGEDTRLQMAFQYRF